MLLQANKALKKKFPNEPWKWHPQWAAGEIKTSTFASALVLTVFALIWNVAAWAIAIAILPEIWEKKDFEGFFILIFPAVGVLLLLAVLKLWANHFRMGKTCLRLETLPGVVGGHFAGAVDLPGILFTHGEPVDVTLTCQNVYRSGSGKNSTIRKKVVWQSQYDTPLQQARKGSSIPISFTIPYACPDADLRLSPPRNEWVLNISGRVNGRKINLNFHVPVYKTAESDPGITKAQVAHEEIERHAVDLKGAKFQVESNARGDLRIIVPSLLTRSPKGFVGIAVFFVIWTGAIVFMVNVGAPIFLAVVFSLFDLLILVIIFGMIFSGTMALVTANEIRVRSKILFFTREKSARAEAVEKLFLKTAMTSQGTSGIPKVWYDLRVKASGQKPFAVVKSSTEKTELEYLGDLIRDKLGINQAVEEEGEEDE